MGWWKREWKGKVKGKVKWKECMCVWAKPQHQRRSVKSEYENGFGGLCGSDRVK
jgi:hypothetical protein